MLSVWNDLSLALRDAFAVASVLANVHPDEVVRTRAEKAEQDASAVETEIGLNRALYDVLAQSTRPASTPTPDGFRS